MHTPSSLLLRTTLLAALAAAPFAASLADPGQRVQEEVQSALLRLVASGEIPAEAMAQLRIDAPASRTPMFGAVIDSRFRPGAEADGVPVAAVTPGSSAEQIGLRAGDRLLSVNGVDLRKLGADAQGRSVAATQVRDAVRAGDDTIRFRVARGEETLDLQGQVLMVDLPAYRMELGSALAGAAYAATGGDGVSGCGRISVFDAAPRGKQVYPAVLIAVDGRLPGPTSSDVYRVEPGKRRLTVAERIDPEQFGGVQRTVRDRQGRDRYKDLFVDVQPGMTYRLGAQFVLEQRNSIRDNAYWEPVVYSEVAETCR